MLARLTDVNQNFTGKSLLLNASFAKAISLLEDGIKLKWMKGFLFRLLNAGDL